VDKARPADGRRRAEDTAISPKATHQQTRAHNERLVLGTIYDHGPISRAEIARRTELTRTTVSDVVADLLANGLTREVGRGPSTGGKAPILLELVPEGRYLIGLDLGDKTFNGALVNLRGEAVYTVARDVDNRDGEAAVTLVLEIVDRLLAEADRPVLGVGIGTAGLIDTSVGLVIEAVNLDWRDLPLGTLVHRRTGLPVYVANDSKAAALAAFVFGDARTSNLVVVKVGKGIGAGILIGGRLFQGDGFGAGEIGHMTMQTDGALCRCGRLGCLETLASSRAILARLAGSAIGPDAAMLEVARAAVADAQVLAVVREAGAALGRAIGWLISVLNIERVVLIGQVTELGEPWLGAVQDAARASALPVLGHSAVIEIGEQGDAGVMLGASALLMTRELGINLAPLHPVSGRPGSLAAAEELAG
jgi:N-acetylglucosamine repressor